MNDDIILLAQRLGNLLREAGLTATTVESCTGGGIAYAVTAVPGSSEWFRQAFVTYANESKIALAGVRAETLARYGAVSGRTVEEMALGGLEAASADLALAVSGIAGPDGGSADKPVGTVWIGLAFRNGRDIGVETFLEHFGGDRAQVRLATIRAALELGIGKLEQLTKHDK